MQQQARQQEARASRSVCGYAGAEPEASGRSTHCCRRFFAAGVDRMDQRQLRRGVSLALLATIFILLMVCFSGEASARAHARAL